MLGGSRSIGTEKPIWLATLIFLVNAYDVFEQWLSTDL